MVVGNKYQVTTKVGKKKFVRTFESVSSVDKFIAGARKLKEKHPRADTAVITLKVIKPKKSKK